MVPETDDVTALLARGGPAVETIAEYVWACRLLGYQHQDLTGRPGQVHEWYRAEDGLDLRAVDAERGALLSAAISTEQALQVHDGQLQALSDSWHGLGAQASRGFLLRHGAMAGQAVAALRAGAQALAQLHDSLHRAVIDRVTATVEIEGRRAAERGAWLAAARTVTTGVGDRSEAGELVDQQVKPFVANDIGGDWLAAMRAATAAVIDAYDDAVAALRSGPVAVFEIPGDLGPTWVSTVAARPSAAPAVTAPAGFAPSPSGTPSWSPQPAFSPPTPLSATPLPATQPLAVDPVAPPVAAPPPGLGQALGGGGLPGMGGMPDIGSGLSGAGQGLADLFGGLIGSAADRLPDAEPLADLSDEPDVGDELDEPESDEADDEGPDDEGPEGDPDESAEPEPEPEPVDDVEEPAPQSVPPEPAPVGPPPAVAAPPAEPPAEPLAAPAGETPCEIAADELPQVGG